MVITRPFIPTARAIARIRGLPDYPVAVVRHPIGSLSEEGLRERAREALPQIEKILLGKP